VVPMKT